MALKARWYVNADHAELKRFGTLLIYFPQALKRHLRDGCRLQDLDPFAEDRRQPAHVPFHLVDQMFHMMHNWRAAGVVDNYELLILDPHLRALLEICGGCERIRNTPVPLSYRALLRHGTALYGLVAPWYLVLRTGLWALPIILLVKYFLYGIELTAEDVENPFGNDGDDLLLDAYCHTIRASVEEALLSDQPPATGGLSTPLDLIRN